MRRLRIESTPTGHISVFKGSQDIHYKSLLDLRNHSLRIDIRYDSYRAQSHGKIERWDGDAWQEVWMLSGPELKGWQELLPHRREAPTAKDFDLDIAELVARAREVLREGVR